jgi:hypothetical protein
MALHSPGDLLGRVGPLLDDRLVAALLVHEPLLVLVLDLGHLGLEAREDLALVGRDHHVVLGDRDPGLRREAEPEVLERVEHERDRRRAVDLHEVVDHAHALALAHRLVDEVVGLGVERLAHRLRQRPLDPVVVDDPPDRRQDVAALTAERAVLGQVVQADAAQLVGELGLLRGAEHLRPRPALGPLVAGELLLQRGQLLGLGPVGQVVRAQHHVLRRRGQRRTVRG